jgi:hypothetical protein
VDEVWGDEFREEGWDDIGEKDNTFGDCGTNEVEGSGEDDNVGDIIDEAWMILTKIFSKRGVDGSGVEVPNSQKATSTEASAPWKMALNLALYIAHDEPGDPGSGRSTEEDGDLVIVVP